MENHYKILGLPIDSSNREITLKYRELSKKLHPDKGGNEYLFNIITNSYNILLNKEPILEKKKLEIEPEFNPKKKFFENYFVDIDFPIQKDTITKYVKNN